MLVSLLWTTQAHADDAVAWDASLPLMRPSTTTTRVELAGDLRLLALGEPIYTARPVDPT